MTLAADDIHLWLLVNDASDVCLLEQCRKLLTDDERRRERTFCFKKGQRQYVLTRALVRTVLSRYSEILPHEWLFNYSPQGRPEIANADSAARELSFNVSHTDGLIVLGVARCPALGVDVEHIHHRPGAVRLAEKYFSPDEKAALRALPADVQPQRFAELWTLKESYVKACGKGLSMPLVLPPEAASRWQLSLLRPTATHVVAVCAERLPGARQKVVLQTWYDSHVANDATL